MRVLRSLVVLATSLTAGACGMALEPAGPPPTVTGTPGEIAARYQTALDRICDTGVTPEAVALYQAVDKLWETQPTGAGRGSNFGGARDPNLAWRACFQSPGWR